MRSKIIGAFGESSFIYLWQKYEEQVKLISVWKRSCVLNLLLWMRYCLFVFSVVCLFVCLIVCLFVCFLLLFCCCYWCCYYCYWTLFSLVSCETLCVYLQWSIARLLDQRPLFQNFLFLLFYCTKLIPNIINNLKLIDHPVIISQCLFKCNLMESNLIFTYQSSLLSSPRVIHMLELTLL